MKYTPDDGNWSWNMVGYGGNPKFNGVPTLNSGSPTVGIAIGVINSIGGQTTGPFTIHTSSNGNLTSAGGIIGFAPVYNGTPAKSFWGDADTQFGTWSTSPNKYGSTIAFIPTLPAPITPFSTTTAAQTTPGSTTAGQTTTDNQGHSISIIPPTAGNATLNSITGELSITYQVTGLSPNDSNWSMGFRMSGLQFYKNGIGAVPFSGIGTQTYTGKYQNNSITAGQTYNIEFLPYYNYNRSGNNWPKPTQVWFTVTAQ